MKTKYQDPDDIIRLRKHASVLAQEMVRYKSFYRKRLNDQTWRQTAITRTWQYYSQKKELNLIYTILEQHNKLKKQHSLINKLQRS